ncbi:prion-like-(Q/N-rich) domain-bearing protein 25 isoform X1 [Anabrus simplex]|uniref:prion-like-(Q/N-rich) domain-bearing protein 25 isoform X1 n=1 Tax=Anabrus simplex TaxID=316456 RepID=UPI0035A2CC20
MDRSVTVAFVCLLLSVSVKDTTAQADPGENCATDSDCQRSATCINNKCICKPEYKLDTQLNKCRAGIGHSCYYDEECILDAFCHERTSCMCNVGLEVSNDKLTCKLTRNRITRIMNSTCTRHENCTQFGAGAFCNQTSWECECDYKSQHFVSGKCWYIKGLGQRCKDTNECYIHDHPNRVECNRFNKTCTCTRGFVASADSLYCNGDAGIIAQLTSGVILLAMFVITRIIY